MKTSEGYQDPKVFGENVRKYRSFLGLNMRDFAKKAGIGVDTVARIQRGEPCSFRIQKKIRSALTISLAVLWEIHDWQVKEVCHVKSSFRRWRFGREPEAHAWALNENSERLDPDSIQNEAERLRLGKIGLSGVFLSSHACYLPKGLLGSGTIEIFASQSSRTTPSTLGLYHLCLRGSVRIVIEEQEILLREGESFICGGGKRFTIKPEHPIGPRDLPPLIHYVTFDVLPKSFHRLSGD